MDIIDINGNVNHNWVSGYIVFSDEIGLPPEEAVMNDVTL
jgi:hypothetical protein